MAGPLATDLRKGALLAAASAVSYGLLAVFVKLAYLEGWNVPSLLAARFVLAALVVLPLALRGATWRGFGGAFLVGAVGYAGTTALYFPSIALLPAAVASFLLYLSPPLVLALGLLTRRETLTRRFVVAMLLAVAGLAFLSSGGVAGTLSVAGLLLAAGSAVVFAGTVFASRHATRDLAWPRATLGVCLGAATSYLVFSFGTGAFAIPPGAPALLYAVGIGTVATGLALSLFMAALPLIGPARTALISTLEPVSTLVLAAIILGEIPGGSAVLGGGLIVASAALVAWDAPPAPPVHE